MCKAQYQNNLCLQFCLSSPTSISFLYSVALVIISLSARVSSQHTIQTWAILNSFWIYCLLQGFDCVLRFFIVIIIVVVVVVVFLFLSIYLCSAVTLKAWAYSRELQHESRKRRRKERARLFACLHFSYSCNLCVQSSTSLRREIEFHEINDIFIVIKKIEILTWLRLMSGRKAKLTMN